MPIINCPSPPEISEGKRLTVTYSISICQGRTVSVDFNGSPAAGFTDSCSNGAGTIDGTAPNRVAGKPNVIEITVTDAEGGEDTCDVAVID